MDEPAATRAFLHLSEAGDRAARTHLSETLYGELRELAERRMRGQPREHTLQPTALVHEAWMRIAGRSTDETSRSHFVALAASSMRAILVDHARRKQSLRRGGGALRLPLDDVLVAIEERAVDVVAVHEALERLEALDPELARIVEMRFFGGLDHREIALHLGVCTRTAERAWRLARSWLRLELDERQPADGGA